MVWHVRCYSLVTFFLFTNFRNGSGWHLSRFCVCGGVFLPARLSLRVKACALLPSGDTLSGCSFAPSCSNSSTKVLAKAFAKVLAKAFAKVLAKAFAKVIGQIFGQVFGQIFALFIAPVFEA
jgi:hypothetical protein